MAKTKINEEGYPVFLDSGKLVHRWRAEKKYGKEVVEKAEIHHIDGDKKNNQDSNLLLVSKEDHYHIHQNQNKVDFLIHLIFCCSIAYFLFLILGALDFINESYLVYVKIALISIILFICLELKYHFIEGAIKRPNEKIWRNEE